MVAFTVALLVAVASMAAAVAYSKRRPVGASLSWGEAMLAAIFCFFVLFLCYGVVPHQWLTVADNEFNWRPDRILTGPGGVFAKLPFDLTYQVLRDAVVSTIYGVFLVAQVVLWSTWQNRGRGRTSRRAIETSAFGRPLVKLVKKA